MRRMTQWNDEILHRIQGNIDHVSWPPVLAGAGATLSALLHHLEVTQWLPYGEIAARQYEQLGRLAAYAAQHSPHFKKRLDDAGLQPQELASAEGLRKLPPLTRRALQEAGKDFYCAQVPQTHMPCRNTSTSGSTGEPVTVIKTAVALLFLHANVLREHFWHQRDFMGRALLIQSEANQSYVTQQGWGHPVNLLFPSGEIRSLPITTDVARQVEEIMSFKPEHMLIYPSNLDAVMTYCEERGIAISGIKHLWSHGSTLPHTLRRKAEAFFGARIEDNYSSSELGVMALQCPVSGLYHVMSESVILEVMDENDHPCKVGETGKIVVTDLHNFATPLVRYAIGDYAEVGGACPCGRGLPTLASIRGRERNMLVKPGSIRHWPRIDIDHFSDYHLIRQCQFIQHTLDDIEARLVVAGGAFTPEQEARFAEYMQEKFGYRFLLRCTYFQDRLPLSPRGKIEEFVSLIS